MFPCLIAPCQQPPTLTVRNRREQRRCFVEDWKVLEESGRGLVMTDAFRYDERVVGVRCRWVPLSGVM